MSGSDRSAPVIVAAGGTGGHVIPALAVVDALGERSDCVPVVWVGTRAGIEARLVPAAGIDIRWIDVAGLRGAGSLRLLSAPLALARAALQSLRLLRELQPRAVLGMGGFVSGPVGVAALLLRRPLVLHEQNAIPGLTNRYLARWATRVFCAWPDVFPEAVGAEAVGNPVRRALLRCRAPSTAANGEVTEMTDGDRISGKAMSESPVLRLLVVGGSRGARFLNQIVPAAAAEIDLPLHIHHQCGESDLAETTERYAAIEAERQQRRQATSSLHERHATGATAALEVRAEAFIDDMAEAYLEADLVICRSGAMTVTELSALGRASLLVPFPHAVDDHQTRNAERLANRGAAVLLHQADLTAERLAEEIRRLHADRQTLVAMATRASEQFEASAAETVAAALIDVGQGGHR